MQHNFNKTINRLRPFLDSADARMDEDDVPFPMDLYEATGRLHAFIPTGNAKLDAIVKAAAPVFKYGAAPANSWPADSAVVDGVMDGSRGWIDMPRPDQFKTPADYRATLAHELVHWTKCKGRSERPNHGRTGWDQLLNIVPDGYPQEEMVAEIGAAILLDYCGEKQDLSRRAAYINDWKLAIEGERNRESAISWAIDKAQAAVDYLLSLGVEK